ncbi:poly-gamma-glutamate synthase PgsB [Halobacillus litoralis]|uniref:Poly-gamma-glutamate synthase PgsB n=1 Tax=Halobacillus litoralis TaxID=45668 RepID=A0A845DT51_9BACI|nr:MULTISPECIES: poly-gamma-glutamate synthase PgsB [Halobacillus]MYL20811.1 poly-gamma-glutamate synthase PgsB [Halobacillus litoralis]MYL30852.1 poly-gamma-glutamate synthase PgsB [Halobacillus halophilus]MYL36341.1 poly-gamma-glutamate synthase PgsB [Halobacillus litoralis]
MLLIPIVLIIVLAAGIYEWQRHKKNIDALPIRVNINGVRGKSTVTRLVTGIVKEAGYKTIGKTTGTSARMIFWDTPEEQPIKRRPEGPNIREQRMVVKEAADRGAEALVSECMAVNPDYQITFQEKMLQANIGVIVNVLEDHMDVLGPTLEEVAESFTATIPYNGHLIVSESPYVEMFKEIAEKRNTEVIVADNSRISDSFLLQFEYMVFPENASLALGVAQALGIDEETAYKGMLNAQPDPGAMRILPMGDQEKPSYFVNGFAANDAVSTINIWKRVEFLGYPTENPIVVMNCREDRVDRTEQFARDVLPYIPTDTLVLIGETTEPIVTAVNEGKIKVETLLDLEGKTTEQIMDVLSEMFTDRVIYGVGNIHGAAEPMIERMQDYKIQTSVS